MDTFEYEISGWWFYLQLLLAEKKCILPPSSYKEYCDEVTIYLTKVKIPQMITLGEAWGMYGTSR